ncbi:NAD-dependent epimerase/dehydratase family protein [Halobacterium salinarum]|uniref:NAD-dependent epimerase/dehydratase family protein n=1 Tax=Halobacterium salinarum TaxID=2242 RepID=UPI002556E14C|nr:NAD-dependent epimerase/dehydratase family protein [Halobacterium salinarum]MDL0120431.1 NAD-dependent epimerase/dehydratase family protein [Halobacterium salinarum]
MTDVIVTGSAGMIGTELCESLLDGGYDVLGVDVAENPWSERVESNSTQVDLRDREELSELPSSADMIVHLAANARVHQLVEDPVRARDNFEMTFNILEFVRESGIGSIIFGSSREVYGNKGKVIYSEEDTYVDECESPYTASKVGGEAIIKSYESCYDIDASILRFSNVYGRYDLSDRVLPLFIAQAAKDQDLTVFGDEKILDFTYLDDCVRGIRAAIDDFQKAKGTTFNIASGEGTSLVELAGVIVDELDADSEVNIEPSRTGEINRYVADLTKAKQVLGYEPTYDFEAGMKKTIEWYTSNNQYIEEILANS